MVQKKEKPNQSDIDVYKAAMMIKLGNFQQKRRSVIPSSFVQHFFKDAQIQGKRRVASIDIEELETEREFLSPNEYKFEYGFRNKGDYQNSELSSKTSQRQQNLSLPIMDSFRLRPNKSALSLTEMINGPIFNQKLIKQKNDRSDALQSNKILIDRFSNVSSLNLKLEQNIMNLRKRNS